jgi:hypothetical protein
LLGLVVKGADDETRQGRGVVLRSGHGPLSMLVVNERTEFNSLYPQRNRMMKGGGLGVKQWRITQAGSGPLSAARGSRQEGRQVSKAIFLNAEATLRSSSGTPLRCAATK